ncbi:fosfomycin resistance glutathione transferase [Chitinimonas lacunae]|uniref:Fosfomycin resistance glutathione transferase n=1 Tax=Chitinimonas lacunae TaxID=1963018 RepID=A0ABV8MTL8_9NEIS
MPTGLNHLTLAVADLDRAFVFYRDLLGATPRARWDSGAYLQIGPLWLCLSLDPAQTGTVAPHYSHIAFDCPATEFARQAERLRQAGVVEWRSNRSEGDSLYFLDPDGHKLELHVGDLASRLAACREQPYSGMQFFPD